MVNTATAIHVCLPIDDRKRAMDFYTTAFGLDPIGLPADDGVPEPLQLRLDARTMLMLIPTGGFGWVLGDRHLAASEVSECLLSVTLDSPGEVDRIAARVAEAGGRILTSPRQQEWGYTALCTDLDGHAWQLMAEPTAVDTSPT